MSGLSRAWPRFWPYLLVAALAVTLAACGKRAELAPPDDATSSYTYPKQYPNAASGQPDTEETKKTQQRLPPPHAGSLSPFPTDRSTTTTYQSGPVE